MNKYNNVNKIKGKEKDNNLGKSKRKKNDGKETNSLIPFIFFNRKDIIFNIKSKKELKSNYSNNYHIDNYKNIL